VRYDGKVRELVTERGREYRLGEDLGGGE